MDNLRNSSSNPSDYVGNYRNHVSPPKKKHTMMLNLENRSSNPFGADQTPTPTRFIRNCEEVGLFQDLQNVNPFEETFRKAVESGKTGSSALQNSRLTVVSDDTLHTPHVFPHIIENDSVLRVELPHGARHVDIPGCRERGEGQELAGGGGGESAHHRSGSVLKVVRQEADTSQLRLVTANLTPQPHVRETDGGNAVPLILQMPDGRLMQVNATPIDMNRSSDLQGPVDLVARVDKGKSEMTSVILHTPQPTPAPSTLPTPTPVPPILLAPTPAQPTQAPVKKSDTENISPFIKEKLKARLGNLAASHANNMQNVANQASSKLGQKDGAGNMRSSASNASNSDDDEETKRQKFLERNRAAAQRCRQKRKFWVEQLERRADWMMADNHQLQLEVTSLRAEVARLKTLLLAHKDCSVTRAVWNNNNIAHQAILPVNLDQVAPVHIIKPLSQEESHFRKNLKKKLRTSQKPSSRNVNQVQEHPQNPVPVHPQNPVPVHPQNPVPVPPEPTVTPESTYLPKKKRLSLNIESAKQSSCFLDEKNNSPLVKNDKFLTSTVLTGEPSELEIGKSVATQVITVNPNVLFRENNLRGASPPLLAISPQAPCIEYT